MGWGLSDGKTIISYLPLKITDSFKGAPIAGYLLAAYGGEHSTLNAYHPAIFYAGSMALGAASLVAVVRMAIDRRFIAKL
jgi:hypothetical protein